MLQASGSASGPAGRAGLDERQAKREGVNLCHVPERVHTQIHTGPTAHRTVHGARATRCRDHDRLAVVLCSLRV